MVVFLALKAPNLCDDYDNACQDWLCVNTTLYDTLQLKQPLTFSFAELDHMLAVIALNYKPLTEKTVS